MSSQCDEGCSEYPSAPLLFSVLWAQAAQDHDDLSTERSREGIHHLFTGPLRFDQAFFRSGFS
jgi:hypothetical protein